MESIWKIVAIIILIIVLLVLIMFVTMGKDIGKQIDLTLKLNRCCDSYNANGCLDETIYCDNTTTLSEVISELGITVEQARCSCNCPNCVP